MRYTDAYHGYAPKIPSTRLKKHRAYGYIVPDPVHTTLFFFKEKGIEYKKGDIMIEGLIIPTKSLVPYNPIVNKDIKDSITACAFKKYT